MPTIIKNINNIYRNLTLVLLVSIMALTACSSDAGTSPPASPSFTATVLPRSEAVVAGTTDFKHDYYRTRYAVFSIRSTVPGDYRIGAKLASKPAPTAAQLRNATAAITRKLGTTDINIYLPTHIEGTYFNTGATQNYDSISNTLLSPNTKYNIFITLADGSGAVSEILSVTTDSPPASVANNELYGFPSGSFTHGSEALIFNGYIKDGGTGIMWRQQGNIILFQCFNNGNCDFAIPDGFSPYFNNSSGVSSFVVVIDASKIAVGDWNMKNQDSTTAIGMTITLQ